MSMIDGRIVGRKTSPHIYFFSVLLLFAARAQAQPYYREPAVVLGVSAGEFRISLDRFEEVYAERWGLCYGGHGDVRIFSNIYLSVSARIFEQGGRAEGVHRSTGVPLSEARWREQWYLIGVRRWMFGEGKWSSSAGLGYALFYLEENPAASVYEVDEHGSGEQRGNGFFITVTLDYALLSRLALSGGLEITSAGVGGRSGLEGLSIGGFYFSLGATTRLF